MHLVAEHVGGGFGAKQNLTLETVAAIELARAARAPVRVALDRGEELSVTGYRPSAEIELALLAERRGRPARSPGARLRGLRCQRRARRSRPSAGSSTRRRAKDLQDYDVVNHMPPGLPFRGPGAPLACLALEQAVDEVAHRLGEDPIALRRRWDPLPQRQRLYDWAESLPLWRDRAARLAAADASAAGSAWPPRTGSTSTSSGCEVEVGVEARTALRGHRRAGHRHRQPQRAREHGGRCLRRRAGGGGGADRRLAAADAARHRAAASATATLVPTTLAAAAELQPAPDRARRGRRVRARDVDWARAARLGAGSRRARRPSGRRRRPPRRAGRPLAGTGLAGRADRADACAGRASSA